MIESTSGEAASTGCRVLVVDDNVDSAQSMSLLLGLEGYEVECAYDGEEALVRAESFRPQVVLLDLGLPRFSGYEVARRLRGEGGAPADESMLLVAVSGYGRERDRQAAREAGFDLHLTKPADPDEVLRVLTERHALRAATLSAARGVTSSGPSPSSGSSGGGSAPGPAAAPASRPDAPAAGATPNA
ncbi:MAG TPA: response regulator [Burkholderiaceae bacterium]|nr:response regulator [Burkholderiaceae bacterium]